MLEEVANAGDESIVSWQPHGKAFRVHVPHVFARTVMLRYFKQTKYKSFLRQLHIYGFHRIGKGMDRGAYFHSMFIRDKKSMSFQMVGQKIKGIKKTSNVVRHRAVADPDFYTSETNVDNHQNQDGHNPTCIFQADPILETYANFKKMNRGYSNRGPTTAFATGSSCDHHPCEDDSLVNSNLLLNAELSCGPSPSLQLSASENGLESVDSMEEAEAQTILTRDEGLASPYHWDISSVFEEDHESSAVFCGVNHRKPGDEGFFAGKRFFSVAEAKTPQMVKISAR